MSKAKPYPDRGEPDEDEPTHLESQWEDEASTTVEQGDVAEKVRTLGFAKHSNTSHTQTGTGVDEPTVDDQHSPVVSAITPIRADNGARLIISQGNDAGQEIELRPGKAYTIGRGLDNDVVLTDIAVSRKHFDLKYEDDTWIIVDRGSGNGTVVNGNVEDNPFMLASGDTIEIGNTLFRFDLPNGAPRPSARAFDEDDEMSTVAGKPLRVEPVDDPPPPPPRPMRPMTLPPPVPLRAAHLSAPPPALSFGPPPGLQAASTLPMPQMANRPPLHVGPSERTLMGDAMGMPMPPPVQTTMPGQGPSYPYPQATEIPPHSVHAQMLMIQTNNGRGDGSTAHVQPQHYDPMLNMAPPRYAPPQLSKRTKLAIAGVALALLTGIVTAAVVKSGSAKPKAPVASAKTDTKKLDTKTKPTAEPIDTTPKPVDLKAAELPKGLLGKTEPVDRTAEAKKLDDEKAAEAKRLDAEKAAEKAAADAKAQVAKVAADAKKANAAKADDHRAASDAKKAAAAEAKKAADAKKAEAKRIADSKRNNEPKTTREARVTTPPPKRTATATDPSAALERADSLYRERKFNDASKVLAAAAKAASDDDAADLNDKSRKYTLLGKSLAVGNAPASSAMIAYQSLTSALNYDANFGGVFKSEIKEKLATVAPKAAVGFIGKKEYGNARAAYLAAQRAGSTDSNLVLVKQKLEQIATELYTAAAAEVNSSPGTAREKLKQVITLVDAKSQLATKAQMLLNKL